MGIITVTTPHSMTVNAVEQLLRFKKNNDLHKGYDLRIEIKEGGCRYSYTP